MLGKKYTLIDLNLSIENSSMEGWAPKISRWNHREGARTHGKSIGINPDEFPDGLCQAWEEITLITHAGTHVDAPWHFYPTSEGKPSKTIDQCPLEWFIGPGVVLDLTHRKAGELITDQDLKEALEKIKYTISPGDIVLVRTDAYKYAYDVNYTNSHPGIGREATLFLVKQGVKVIGTDGYGYDKPFQTMGEEHKKGVPGALWPGHYAGRDAEYCHIESMANLDKIPVPFGFTVCAFPILIDGASAGWCRAVAIIEKQ